MSLQQAEVITGRGAHDRWGRPTTPDAALGRPATIGERVGWYRRRRGMSQEACAGLVERTTDWLSKVENGRRDLDRLSMIRALADVLRVSVGDLADTYEPPTRQATLTQFPAASLPAVAGQVPEDTRTVLTGELHVVQELLRNGRAATARARLNALAQSLQSAPTQLPTAETGEPVAETGPVVEVTTDPAGRDETRDESGTEEWWDRIDAPAVLDDDVEEIPGVHDGFDATAEDDGWAERVLAAQLEDGDEDGWEL